MTLELNEIPSTYEFWGVKGIDRVSIKLDPTSKINVFIGNNGVGKTKTLECLYQVLLFSNTKYDYPFDFSDRLAFSKASINGLNFLETDGVYHISNTNKFISSPVVYIPAQDRGYINEKNIDSITPLGSYEERKKQYFRDLYSYMGHTNKASITEWFIQRAMSTNDYQRGNDNREIELLSVLNVLNKIDSRISNDKSSFSIPGGNSVEFTIDGQKRKLQELSTGFASLIRIAQSIISGYSFFTNSRDIENEKGVVIIDEIESHLHISWQTRILPILNSIFPNTTFIIATHSSLVLSQLYNGKAYQLVNENGVVVNKEINNPSNEAFIDLLSTAFNVNLNDIKLANIQPERYKKQQEQLFNILGISE
ncbi:AAA family ATPase [Conservatibacter flavescens]|uniref:Recombinase RecF n=1 Tax=Conservatibacter flavescens TaxID=28161 RepID=A0A2M8S3J9_9PAST|nr:AAA family ATPase [Conservatibacter flavescens]PJG85724.1 recombinase RecF [Conservatibacter flavescens]